MPSTTIIAQPGQLMPAYNPIKYIINNTNKNEPGFRYIFTIYPAAGSHTPPNVVAQYKVLPVYGTGYGEQDISLLMQSLVTYDESGIFYGTGQVNESWYQYDVDLGYEYIYNVDYFSTLQNNGGNVRIVLTGTPNLFVAGDQVIIAQTGTGPTGNPALEGLHTVISATGSTFTVNVLWSTIGESTANGNVAYADQRKTVVLNDALITNKEVFNGAFNLFINNTDNAPFPSSQFLATNSNGLLMTSNYVSITYPAAAFYGAQFYYNLRVYAGANYEVEWYDMNSNLLDNASFNPASDGIYAVFVGPTALVTEDYYVNIYNDAGFGNNDPYYFTYDNRCTINDQQLIYLDRMGSWQSFAFQLRTYEKGQITREQYNQHIDGQVVSTEWVGKLLQKGFRTYNTNVTKTFDLNTNWMGDYDAKRFQELLTSPQVYYYSPNYLCACVVDSSSFEVFSQKNKKLIKQSVTIRLAQQDPING